MASEMLTVSVALRIKNKLEITKIINKRVGCIVSDPINKQHNVASAVESLDEEEDRDKLLNLETLTHCS